MGGTRSIVEKSIERFPAVIRLWNLASGRTTPSWVAGRVGTLVKYPVAGRGFAEGARPHRGGCSQAGSFSRSLGRSSLCRQRYQGQSPGCGNSGIFSPPSAPSGVYASFKGSSGATPLVSSSQKLMGLKAPESSALLKFMKDSREGTNSLSLGALSLVVVCWSHANLYKLVPLMRPHHCVFRNFVIKNQVI